MKPFPFFRCNWLAATCASVALLSVIPVEARILLESICTIQGQHEQRIVGMGLVVGLSKTGDSASYLPKIRALGAVLKLLNNPVDNPAMLKDSNNVALVLIEATVPSTGIRRGQKLDCFVSSIGDAKSLRGGRLLVSPLQRDQIADDRIAGIAAGHIAIEDSSVLTNGRITNGVVIEDDFDDFSSMLVENNSFNLLLDREHATFRTANSVAEAINGDIFRQIREEDSKGEQGRLKQKMEDVPLSRALSAGVIHVPIPDVYSNSPAEFIAEVLNVGIDYPHSEARVVVNAKNGTCVVTGEVEISPVVIAHKNLSINVGTGDGGGDQPQEGFVPLMEKSRSASHSLTELIDALDRLRVPAADKIEIIKELKRTGKLHAVLITE